MKVKFILSAAFASAFGFMFSVGAVPSPAQMVGDYREASKTDRAVVSAANFAVKKQSEKQKNTPLKLISIEKAEKQVVAGMNYRMCLSVNSNKKMTQATATVYQNIKNEFSLTEWTDGKCANGKTGQSEQSDDIGKNGISATSNAPNEIVKNLYAADKINASPFSQTKSRALVDKYFTKDFADMIWKDAVTSKSEVGAIDGNPLYNAQDRKITAFAIGKPEYDTGSGSGMATVLVSFKNYGKADTVKYLFAKDAANNWKITDIVFSNGDMLKGILYDSQRATR